MPANAEARKDLVERLSRMVVERHAQAPAEVQGHIEKGYEEVIDKLAHLLTLWKPAGAGVGDPPPLGTCHCNNPPHSFPAYQADCQALGCTWTRKPNGHHPHPE
jgi:hypothetical protein